MKYYVFKTDITSELKVRKIKQSFEEKSVIDWWVDTQDVDHVLRVNDSNFLNEHEIMQWVRSSGFYCEPLLD